MSETSRKAVLVALVTGTVLLAATIALLAVNGEFPAAKTVAETATIGGPFRLTTMDGGTLSNADLKGKPFAIFFGFTRCPEICPTTLSDLTEAMSRLGPDADRLKVLFVSLDPTRDTPELLKQYLTAFDPRIIGLTGSEGDVAKPAHAYRVFWEKVATGDGDYTLNHTASVYLMDRDGAFTGVIDYQESIETTVAKLKRLVESGRRPACEHASFVDPEPDISVRSNCRCRASDPSRLTSVPEIPGRAIPCDRRANAGPDKEARPPLIPAGAKPA